MDKKVVNLSQLNAKTAIAIMLEGSELKTYKDLAEKMGKKEYTFRSALHNNALRVRELQEIADILGYEIHLIQK